MAGGPVYWCWIGVRSGRRLQEDLLYLGLDGRPRLVEGLLPVQLPEGQEVTARWILRDQKVRHNA